MAETKMHPLEIVFLNRCERFAQQWGYTDSDFGRAAIGDPRILGDMRKERAISLRLALRIVDFMKLPEDVRAGIVARERAKVAAQGHKS